MALSATFRGIEKVGGKFYVRIGKVSREFESLADVRRWARSSRDDFETFHRLLVAVAIGDANDLATINANIGKQITLDLAAAQKVTVS